MSNLHIAILSFNHPQITSKTIESALQFYPQNSITLVHNGSMALNVEYLKQKFPEIGHLELTQNRGFSGGANYALKTLFTTNEWIYFLTNDVELLKINRVPNSPALVAPKIFRRKREVVDSIGAAFNCCTGKLRHLKQPNAKLGRFEYFYVPGTAFLIHRDIFQKIGGFDETLHTYWEDVDFSIKAQKMNLEMRIDEEFELMHKVGKTCHKKPFYTNFLFKRNRAIIWHRYSPILLKLITKINCLFKLRMQRQENWTV